MQTIELCGVKIDDLDLNEALLRLEAFISDGDPHLITTPNPEMIVAAQEDETLKNILNNSHLRLPDGISMVVVSRLLGRPLKERITGIDFLLAVSGLSARKGYKIFLLGGEAGVAEAAAGMLLARHKGVNICGWHDGFFKDDGIIIKELLEAKPDILFAGLGAGKQEKWLARNLLSMGVPVCVGVGGSFDVIAGKKRRAPKWIQGLYIEWLYRLITEPARWKRQLALPRFLWLVFRPRF